MHPQSNPSKPAILTLSLLLTVAAQAQVLQTSPVTVRSPSGHRRVARRH
jgi:hypothetical protein